MILAIDTSTDEASVALADHSATLAETNWRARGNHSRHLTDTIQKLLALLEADVHAIDCIAVAIGPGSFSGIRVGVSEAKGLAMALGAPLAGIMTLDMIGYQASWCARPLWAVISAGRGEVYAASYEGSRETWRRTSEYLLLSAAALAGRVRSGEELTGPGADLVAGQWAGEGEEPQLVDRPWRMRRAGFLAELGWRYFDAGGEDETYTVEPQYLRLSAAEEKRSLGGHRSEV